MLRFLSVSGRFLSLCVLFVYVFSYHLPATAQQWQTYSYSNTMGIPGTIVTSAVKDAQGNIWLGTDAGVAKFDVSTLLWYRYPNPANNPAAHFIYKLVISPSGKLYACTSHGLANYIPAYNNWSLLTSAGGLPGNIIRDADAKGIYQTNLWIATYGAGVSFYNGSTFQNYNSSHGLAGNLVNCVLHGHNGEVWFGTSNGISRFSNGQWSSFTVHDGLPSNQVISVEKGPDGSMWFGTTQGIGVYQNGLFTTINTGDGLAGNTVYDILYDTWGNFWFTTNNGISKYDLTTWETFNTTNGPASDTVYCVMQYSADEYWFGLQSSGVSVMKSGQWSHIHQTEGLFNSTVKAMAEDDQGQMWFGSGNGLSVYNGNSWKNYTTANTNLHSHFITGLSADNNGNMWITTSNGVARFNGSQFTTYNTGNGLPASYINCIYRDNQNRMWFGTNNGASHFAGNGFVNYTTGNGMTSNNIRQICQDNQNRIWFLHSAGVNFSIFDGTSFSEISRPFHNGQYVNVYGIGTDLNGRIWALTSSGLFKNNNKVGWILYPLTENYYQFFIQTNDQSYWLSGGYNGLIRIQNNNFTYFHTINGWNSQYPGILYVDSGQNLWVVHQNGVSKTYAGQGGQVSMEPYSHEIKINTYPNPFSHEFSLEFSLPEPSSAEIMIYNVNGSLVYRDNYGLLPSGKHEMVITPPLKDGLYLLGLTVNGNNSEIKKIVKTK